MSQHRSPSLPIVFVVSFAHATVHLVEQSFASVEQVVSTEFGLTIQQSGALGSALRFPFGFGSVLTGILADRMGAPRVLVVYLAGISLVSGSFFLTATPSILWIQMFLLGVFASMYHPAGLSLLTSVTTPSNRARALGIHGVFGSLGLAAAPFLASTILLVPGTNWRLFFLVVGLIAGALGFLFRAGMSRFGTEGNAKMAASASRRPGAEPCHDSAPDRLLVRGYSILLVSSACSGIVYGGFLHFLKRYLSDARIDDLTTISRDAAAGGQAALVLFFGVAGQWIAGQVATPRRLPAMLSLIYLATVPLLCWMSFASGLMSLVPCCLLAFVHFMNQPVYNSLLPEYVPVKTRSTWFGVSQMMTFGIGAAGPSLVGSFANYREAYLLLSVFSLVSGILPIGIWIERHRRLRAAEE